jgi:hypothetical protein
MSEKMTDEQIDKIAQALAAKLAEPGGGKLLGCGSASSSQYYSCNTGTYSCSSYYECGGAASFSCTRFDCYDNFHCVGDRWNCVTTFNCSHTYSYA